MNYSPDGVVHCIPGSGNIVNEELVDRHHLKIIFYQQEQGAPLPEDALP